MRSFDQKELSREVNLIGWQQYKEKKIGRDSERIDGKQNDKNEILLYLDRR